MRALLVVIAVLAALYAGYWGVGHRGITQTLDQAEQAMRDNDARLEYADRVVTGFPSRFDLTYSDVSLTSNGLTYETSLAQVFTLAYKPNHVIAFAPGPHHAEGPFGRVTLTTDDLRASLRVTANTDLPLAEARVAGRGLDLQSDDMTARMQDVNLAIRAAADARYDLFFEAKGIAPAQLDAITEGSPLPATISSLRGQGIATLDAPMDRHGAATTLRALAIHSSTLAWGDSRVTLSADLTFDADGLASGSVTVTALNWEPLVTLAERQSPDMTMLRPMAEAANDEAGQLRMIFSIRAGHVFVGPLPIGQIPPLR